LSFQTGRSTLYVAFEIHQYFRPGGDCPWSGTGVQDPEKPAGFTSTKSQPIRWSPTAGSERTPLLPREFHEHLGGSLALSGSKLSERRERELRLQTPVVPATTSGHPQDE
jgi:hypothetical protein